jgi:hypothetical protein
MSIPTNSKNGAEWIWKHATKSSSQAISHGFEGSRDPIALLGFPSQGLQEVIRSLLYFFISEPCDRTHCHFPSGIFT